MFVRLYLWIDILSNQSSCSFLSIWKFKNLFSRLLDSLHSALEFIKLRQYFITL